ncbi:hypothetical protein C0J52_07445 [Blattella germanica]|nr:hypothetical protein C0J52_07445 [Blattella germanica]
MTAIIVTIDNLAGVYYEEQTLTLNEAKASLSLCWTSSSLVATSTATDQRGTDCSFFYFVAMHYSSLE